MDALDRVAEKFDGADRVAHVVEEHVGGVEVDLEVGGLQVVEGLLEEFSGLLAGLKGESDAVFAGDLTGLGQCVE